MNKKIVGKYIGYLLVIEGAFMIPALIIALVLGESRAAFSYVVTIAALGLIGLMLLLLRARDSSFYAKEGFVTVALSWIVMSLFGAIPMYMSGAIPNIVDAFFETVSGFTTTGASILTEIESLPKSILYWRSFTHWLGGMGVLVFILAVIPLDVGSGVSLHILRAESPGPSVGKLVPKMRSTARLLYAIYIVLTVVEMALLIAGGMPIFDSVTTAFGTAGTGGFSVRNASMAAYDSYYLQGVVTVFMILFGVNFNIYYLLLLREFKVAFGNMELRVYLSIITVAVAVITLNVYPLIGDLYAAFHHSAFQVASIITTTGFATVDYTMWPELSKVILVALMFIGASAGSTGGGMKVSRFVILFKGFRNELKKLVHPRSVKLIRVDGKTVNEEISHNVNVFFFAYVLIFSMSCLLVAIDNFSFETTFTAVAACLNNIGPGLDIVGPMGNYSAFSPLCKLILSADMLFGRLEIFPMLLLFTPSMWRRTK